MQRNADSSRLPTCNIRSKCRVSVCGSVRANFIIILLVLSGWTTGKKSCNTEVSKTSKGQFVSWKSRQTDQIVISRPSCIDKESHLVTRSCIGGLWHPLKESSCVDIILGDGNCPNYFQHVDDDCIIVIDDQMWTDRYKLPIPKSKELYHDFRRRHVWLPVRRQIKYGQFEYTDPGDDYGKIQHFNLMSLTDIFGGDCVVIDTITNRTQPVNCNQRHSHVRQFSKTAHFYKCPENCVAAGIDIPLCYCKKYDDPCSVIATVKSLYDQKRLQKVAGNDFCNVNEAMDSSEQGSGSIMNKAFWRHSTEFVNCSLCQTKALHLNETSLVLSFEESKRTLYLTVYSPESLMQFNFKDGYNFEDEDNDSKSDDDNDSDVDDNDDDDYAIYCFTDAANDLKKRVKIEKVWVQKLKSATLNSLIVYELKLEKLMGQYWCEGFYMNGTTLLSNTVIAYRDKSRYEFALRIKDNICIDDFCPSQNIMTEHYVEIIATQVKNRYPKHSSRVMKIFYLGQDYQDILAHISIKSTHSVVDEYNQFLAQTPPNSVLYFRSSEVCLPEITNTGALKLEWNLAKIGESAISEPLCLMANGQPIIRTCQGNFLEGAFWSQVAGECAKNISVLSPITNLLRQFSKLQLVPFKEVGQLLRGVQNLTILDVYYVSKILERFEQSPDKANLTSDVLDIVEALLDTDAQILQQSQDLLNLTDITLNIIDDFLVHVELDSDQQSTMLTQRRNFMVHITNPFISNISGLMLYGEDDDMLHDFQVEDFKRNNSLDIINTSKLKVAVFVPESVLDQIANEAEDNISNITIVTAIFYKDSFFLDSDFQPVSYIASLSVPGYGSYLKSPLSIVFRSTGNPINSNDSHNRLCAFWDNSRKGNRKKGKWSTIGANYLGNFNEDTLHLCSFSHLTHLGLLIMRDTQLFPFYDIDTNDWILNIITITGGIISLLGICSVFLTASVFEEWRKRSGTKILMNLSVAILLETICLHLSEITVLRESETSCKILGMILHYVVISKFCWMLVYAALQYLRFVRVVGSMPHHLLLKSMLFGWGLPLILVLIAGLATSQSYVSRSYEICYPRGTLLYLSVLLPICAITAANFSVFCIIMYEITHRPLKSATSRNSHQREVNLAILLFFVLGIPWLFGIFAELMAQSLLKIVLFYVFCITGNLQGFVLSMFYVVFNNEVRRAWANYIKATKNF